MTPDEHLIDNMADAIWREGRGANAMNFAYDATTEEKGRARAQARAALFAYRVSANGHGGHTAAARHAAEETMREQWENSMKPYRRQA